MNPEEIQALEDQAAKENPEACVKLSFHLMATDSSNPETRNRAAILNKKAEEGFKGNLIRSIGAPTFASADCLASCKLHLGLLYEIGPIGIRRDTASAFYLIQDALGSFDEGNPNFPLSNKVLDKPSDFGYALYPSESKTWKEISEIKEKISELNNATDPHGIKVAETLKNLEDRLNQIQSQIEEGDTLLISEVLYNRARIKFLLLDFLSNKAASTPVQARSLACLFEFIDLDLKIVEGNFIISSQGLDQNGINLVNLWNDCFELLYKSAKIGNGCGLMEFGLFYDALAAKRETSMRGSLFQKALAAYSALITRSSDPRAMYHCGLLKERGSKSISLEETKDFYTGVDLFRGPDNVDELIGNFEIYPPLEELKYILAFNESHDFYPCHDDLSNLIWRAPVSERCIAEKKLGNWKRSLEFISKIRKERPLSLRIDTTENFEQFRGFQEKWHGETAELLWDISEDVLESGSVRKKTTEPISFDVHPPIIRLN